MIRAHTTDITKGWIYDVHPGWPKDAVREYCVNDPNWQKVRLSMKGQTTVKKLQILEDWYHIRMREAYSNPTYKEGLMNCVNCQVDNYLGALRRGGQLDMHNMIKKVI